MSGRRVLVCGGRDYDDRLWVFATLNTYHAEPDRPITCIIEGGATGADRLAREWAESRSVPVETFLPDWPSHGSRAGPIRNGRMLTEGRPDLVIAFPGGKGTDDMVKRALRASVPTMRMPQRPV